MCLSRIPSRLRLLYVIPLFAVLALAQPRRLPETLRAIPTPRPVSLGPLADSERPKPRGGALPIGVSREVPAAALARPAASVSADGRAVITAAVNSVGASRIRVHFQNFDVGKGEVWVYGAGGQIAAGPYTGRGIFESGEFWSGGVEGPTVVVTYVAPAGAAAERFPFTVDVISHEWISAANGKPLAGPYTATAADCNVDVSCRPEYQKYANAVTRLTFMAVDPASGKSRAYLCSGSMLDTRSGSQKPYLLTANHCISSESEAQSLEVFYFYQTASCNGPDPGLSALPTVVGGSYLAGGGFTSGDYSLVLLRQDAPTGATYLKYSTALDTNAAVFGIHHPSGSFKRISIGNRIGDARLTVGSETAPAESFYQVKWTSGVIEGGSSGSPLFDADGNVVGTLTAGPDTTGTSACAVTPLAYYGRFSKAYADYIPFLEDASSMLTVSPTSLAFSVTDGVAAETSKVVTLTTGSTTPISFTTATNRAWMNVSSGGTLSAAAPATVTVTLDPTQLTTAGTFNGFVTITPAAGSAVNLVVTVSVARSQSNVSMSFSPNPVYYSETSKRWNYSLTFSESAGVDTRVSSLKVDDYEALGSSFSLAGLGSVTLSGWVTGVTPPETLTFVASGKDVSTARAWQISQDVPFVGPWSGPVLTLTAVPGSFTQNPDSSAACQWTQTYVVRETAGHPALLSGFLLGSLDLSSELARDFGAVRLPANGALMASVCRKTQAYVPAALVAQISGTDDAGVAIGASAYYGLAAVQTNPSPPTLSVSPAVTMLTPSSATSRISVGLGASTMPWSASVVSQFGASWLSISPASGLGAANINLTANPEGLADGYYSATVLVQAANAYPQAIPVTVGLQVGAAGPPPVINAGGITNAWNAKGAMAPGSLVSIWGANLATAAAASQATPFENRMAGTSVTINGVQAPLYYVSPAQLNVQVPFETSLGTAQVVVTVNGQSANTTMQVTGAAPGICTDYANGRLCRDRLGNNPSGKPGDIQVLYLTGQGAVTPSVATGAAPFASTPLANWPKPVGEVKITVGGASSRVDWMGIPTWSVGVLQVNFQVPDVAAGDQPVVVTIGGQPSQTAVFTVTQ
jgi:uncharacterized protein (TIGR03437 family)